MLSLFLWEKEASAKDAIFPMFFQSRRCELNVLPPNYKAVGIPLRPSTWDFVCNFAFYLHGHHELQLPVKLNGFTLIGDLYLAFGTVIQGIQNESFSYVCI